MPLVFLADTADAAWGTTTVDNTGVTGRYTSIAVGTSGAAYISYYDVTRTALMYATNVSGEWGTTTVDNAANTGEYTSIAVGTSGAVYISYNAISNGDLVCHKRQRLMGEATVDNTGLRAVYLHRVGSEYISYHDSTNGDPMYATTAT